MLPAMLAVKYDVAVRGEIYFLDRVVPIHCFLLMLHLIGPLYKYQGERLKPDEIVYVMDHHWDEEDGCFHVDRLLAAHDPQQHLLVFDHLQHEDSMSHRPHVCLPAFLAMESGEFREQEIVPDWQHKTHIFNFMINKPRVNRYFLLLLLDHFGLSNYTYSLAWQDTTIDRAWLARKINNDRYRDIIMTARMDLPATDYRFGPETRMIKGVRNGLFRNACTYQQLLQKPVFEPSCVSLITEPCFFEREAMITEKTIMALYAGTLPIWIGGWALPDNLRRFGFDVFDDVVDHSYQRLEDPWDRAYEAIRRNLDLLRDFDQVKNIIDVSHDRFRHNIDLVERNVFLEDVRRQCDQDPRLLDVANKWSLPV